MRLTNFGENHRKSYQGPSSYEKSQTLQQNHNFTLEIQIRLSHYLNNFPPITQTNSNQILSSPTPKYSESTLQVLGITLMKIIAHQILDNGYSSLKLNILKTIHDMEKQNIFHQYLAIFNFKTSSHDLVTILNSSHKIIKNSLQKLQLSDKYLHTPKNIQQYQRDCKAIHQIVIQLIKQFPICVQFFSVLFKMILMLVHYPKLNQCVPDLQPKEVYFIVCEYLGCRIQQNSQCYFFQKGHFIKQYRYHYQFGLFINFPIKSKSKKLFSSAQNKNQSKSTNDLFYQQRAQTNLPNRSRSSVHKKKYVQSCQSLQSGQNNFSLFLNINQKDIKKCQSRLQINNQESFRTNSLRKENQQWESLKNQGNDKFRSSLNTKSSVSINKTDTMSGHKYLSINGFKSTNQHDWRCVKCTKKKDLKLVSNVIRLEI